MKCWMPWTSPKANLFNLAGKIEHFSKVSLIRIMNIEGLFPKSQPLVRRFGYTISIRYQNNLCNALNLHIKAVMLNSQQENQDWPL